MRKVILESKRLELVTTINSDIEYLYKTIFSVAEVVKYTNGRVLLESESKEFIKKKFNFSGSLGFSPIIEKKSSNLVGYAGVLPFLDGYEIGYIFAKEYWGKGFATEIAKAQIDFIKSVLNSELIYATVHPKNRASINVLDKLEFNFLEEKELKRGLRRVYKL
jgi:RimJ/RimL family protein N-acetyltransferase